MVTDLELTVDPAAPQVTGTVITLTGDASGKPGVEPHYQFYVRTPAGAWSITSHGDEKVF